MEIENFLRDFYLRDKFKRPDNQNEFDDEFVNVDESD